MARTSDFASASPWLAEVDADVAAPLREDTEADVVVIGAGYTGLSSALALREEGLSVVVLEANFAGYGASGRNAGHLTLTIGKDIPTVVARYDARRARALLHLADLSIRQVETLIEKHRIDCHYEAVGNVIAAVHPRQRRSIERAARAAEEFGLPGELLDSAALRRRGLPSAFEVGFLEPQGGILDPARYVRGLRRAALDAGARLFESTPVLRLETGSTPQVHTDSAVVRARYVVVATNGYTHRLGLPRLPAIPLHVQLFRTAPLSEDRLAAVGWQGREGVYTAHEMLESYRLTRDNRIVGGAKRVRYGYGGRLLPDRDPGVAQLLEATFRRRFPELAGLEIDRHWGGPIAITLDFLPLVGRMREHENVLYAVSFAGHGLAVASYAGTMVADLIAGRSGPGEVLWSRRPFPLPPEPARWLVFRALTGYLGWQDARIDRAV